jgi:hypothetical protein
MNADKDVSRPEVRRALAILGRQLAECTERRDFFVFAKAWARFFMIASDVNELVVAWAQVRRWTDGPTAGNSKARTRREAEGAEGRGPTGSR